MGKSLVATKAAVKALRQVRKNQRGMATAEYAVGTLAAVSFGGILVKIITDPEFRNIFFEIIKWILGLIKPLIG